VVVAHGHQHPAVARGAGHVGVAHRVAGAVHARALAVPQAKDPVEAPFAAQLRLLAAPERGGGEILVQAFLEQHVGRAQLFLCPAHLHVHRAQRRAAVAGNVTGGVQPRRAVARLLHQHQPHQRLRPVEQTVSFDRSNRSFSEIR
jgi:hypothetical protein